MEKQKINILVFSPSARKIWVDYKKALNHVYFLLAFLVYKMQNDFNIYTIAKSLDPVDKIKQYNGEQIDIIISLGATYNPATYKIQLNKGFAPHERAFEIGFITKSVIKKFNPIHINFCVDAFCWFDKLTEVFGTKPDYIISEQKMKWQQIGYYLNLKLYKQQKNIKKRDFIIFAGGLKSRGKLMSEILDGVTMKTIIHGGGWDNVINQKNVKLYGFMPYLETLKTQFRAKYGLLVNDKIVIDKNYITSRMFEYFGTETVAFVVRGYDNENKYFPKDYILRVNSGAEIMGLINKFGYKYLLNEQNKLINPDWLNFEQWFVKPTIKEINEIWDGRNK